MVRKINCAVSESPQLCIDNFPPPLLFKVPRITALDPRNTGCPLSLKFIVMSSATRFRCPSCLKVCVPNHFSSHPGPRNDQCPFGNHHAHSRTDAEVSTHSDSFFSSLHTMSLYIDMKMIRSVNCSGTQFISSFTFGFLEVTALSCVLGKNFHPNNTVHDIQVIL